MEGREDEHSWLEVVRRILLVSGLFFVCSLVILALGAQEQAVWDSANPGEALATWWERCLEIAESAANWSAAVAPWVVPAAATVLVTVLVWLAIPSQHQLVPYWVDGEARFDDPRGILGVAETRIVVGALALSIAGTYLAWSVWCLVWLVARTPAERSHLLAALIFLPVILVLGAAGGRYARGQMAVRLLWARAERARSLERADGIASRVPERTGPDGQKIARGPALKWIVGVSGWFASWLLILAAFWIATSGTVTLPVVGVAALYATLASAIGLLCARAVYALLCSSSAVGRVEGVLIGLLAGIVAMLPLLVGVLWLTFSVSLGLLFLVGATVPVLIWITPWWESGKFVLAADAQRELARAANAAGSVIEDIEKQLKARYQPASSPRSGLAALFRRRGWDAPPT